MGRRERQATRRGLRVARASLAIAAALALACGTAKPRPVDPECGAGDGTETEVEVDRGVEADGEQVAAVAAAMNHYGPAIHTCWQTAAADDFRLEGTVTMRLVLGNGGAVAQVVLEGDEAGDKVLTECLVNLWRGVEWPAAAFNPGDEIRLPPLSFIAPEGQHVVASAHAVSYPLDAGGDSHATVLLDHKNSGNGAAAMTALTMAPGFSVPLHRHVSTEVIYMLKGAGELVDARGTRKPIALAAGSAAYIPPGAPHAFKVTGTEAAVALQLYTPGGPEQRFKGIDVGGTTPVASATRTDPRVAVKNHKQAASYKIASGSVSLLFEAETAPGSGASVAGLTLEPRAAIAAHRHDTSSELLFIIEGAGTLTIGGQAREVGRFDAIQIPPGVEHSFVGGAETVKAIQFYSPSGPEQRFKSK